MNLPILELCMVTEQHPGMRLSRRWWEKEGTNLDYVGEAAGVTEVPL